MITIELLDKEISEIENGNYPAVYNLSSDEKEQKKILKQREKLRERVTFLRIIRAYLRSNPTKEFIEKEYARIDAKIKAIDAGWWNYKDIPGNRDGRDDVTLRAAYNKEMGMTAIKAQLRNLDFILHGDKKEINV